MAPLTFADHIFFALIAFVIPLLVVWRRRADRIVIPQDTGFKIRIYWLNSLVLWVGATAVFIIWWILERPFDVLGFTLPERGTFPHWAIIVAVFGLLYLIDATISWNSDEQHPAAGILPANWKEFAHFGSIVSFSAAVCEETVFRGFFITYLLTLLEGNPNAVSIAIVGSSFVFGVAHEYQGGVALVKITVLSILFAVLFVMTKSLLVVIALHFLVDFCSGLLAVMKFKEDHRYVGRITHT